MGEKERRAAISFPKGDISKVITPAALLNCTDVMRSEIPTGLPFGKKCSKKINKMVAKARLLVNTVYSFFFGKHVCG